MRTATSFYAAINSLLKSSDPLSLRALLDAGFVDHAAAGEPPGTTRDLKTSLLAIRTSFPNLRLETSSTILGGDLVASTLSVTGNAHGLVNGVAVEAQLNGPAVDLLRIDSGMVIERWASSTLPNPPKVETIATIAIDRLPSARVLLLERLVFEGSTSRALSVHEGTVLIVESGGIGVRLRTYGEAAHSGTPAVPDSGDLLVAGAVSYIPAGSPFSLETSGSQTASVLQLRIEGLSPGDRTVPTTVRQVVAPGVTRELLVQGTAIRPSNGPVSFAIHMVTLSAGTTIAKHRVAETEIVWVMDGSVQVEIDNGDVGSLTEQGTVSRRSGLFDLSIAQGITGFPGTEVACRASGQSSANVLLITVVPVEPIH